MGSSAAEGPIRVAIVDDEVLVREFISSRLEGVDGIEVVAEADSGRGAVEIARGRAPDVMLMDVRMPGGDGIAATAEIGRVAPAVRVIAMTSLGADEYVQRMLAAGARSYLVKARVFDEIEHAIRSVVRGENAVVPLDYARGAAADASGDDRRRAERAFAGLSPREQDVARLMAQGEKNPAIAEALGIATGTVRSHEEAVLRKLGAGNRTIAAQIVALAGHGPELFPAR